MESRLLHIVVPLLFMVIEVGSYRLPTQETYFVTVPRKIYPGMIVRTSVTILELSQDHMNVRASIRMGQVEYASVFRRFESPSSVVMSMQFPQNAPYGNYLLYVEGTLNGGRGGPIWHNTTSLIYDMKRVSVFIQTNKPIYYQGQNVSVRVIPVTPDLKPVNEALDIYVRDATNTLVRRWKSQQTNAAGIIENKLTLADQVHYGTWKIQVDASGYLYEKSFEVEEFFMQAIDVNVSMPSYVFEDAHSIAGLVTANLSLGQPVTGAVTMRCEVRLALKDIQPNTEYNWPYIERETKFISGVTSFIFTLSEITALLQNRPDLGETIAGKEIYVEAKVRDWYWLQEARGHHIAAVYSRTPVISMMGDQSRTFKPNMPMTVYFAVQQEDGTPLDTDRRMMFIERTVRELGGFTKTLPEENVFVTDDSIVRYSFTPEDKAQFITVTASYDKLASTATKVTFYRYHSPSNVFLRITTSTEKAMVNDYMIFTITSSEYVETMYYQIVAKGNVISIERLNVYGRQTTFYMSVSEEMAPNAHIVAWFFHRGEVISDALNFFINSTHHNPVNVTFNAGKDFTGATMEVTGLTDPGAFIYFSAIDYELYRHGGDTFLDDIELIRELKTYDSLGNDSYSAVLRYPEERRSIVHFPSPTYSVDANSTFEFAGLVVFTDANMTHIPHSCNVSRGDLPCMDTNCYRIEEQCDGVRQCEDGADEMGCERYKNIPDKFTPAFRRLGRHKRHLEQTGEWFWQGHFVKPDGRVDLKLDVSLEPMMWIVGGFSLSSLKGLNLIHQHGRFHPTKSVYMRMQMPSDAYKGEQIGIRITLFNLRHEYVEVLVMLHGSDKFRYVAVNDDGVVSSYAPELKSGSVETMVYMEALEYRELQFPIVPVDDGCIEVTVSAATDVDRETRKGRLCVTYDGVTNFYHTPYLIDMVTVGSQLTPDMQIPITERFIRPGQREHEYVPGSQAATVNVIGDVFSPGLFEWRLTTEDLLRKPYGSAEQNLFNFGYYLYNIRFLKDTAQLTDHWKKQALDVMNEALQRQLSYFNASAGYFSAFRDYEKPKPSLWITAFALKTLQDSRIQEWERDFLIEVDLLNRIADWICLQQNKSTGAFNQTGPLYDVKMVSNATLVDGMPHYNNLSLTAHVLIALAKADDVSGNSKINLNNAVNKAKQYLELNLETITDPYQMAIVTYALYLTGSYQKTRAFNKLHSMRRIGEHTYWASKDIPANPSTIINTVPYLLPRHVYDNEAHAVEATSYALMTYILHNHTDTFDVVKWLQTKRNSIGGFGSTMDSIVALQALWEYGKKNPNRHLYNMALYITATSSPGWQQIVQLNQENFMQMQKVHIPKVFGQVKINVQGNGIALMQMESKVNVEYTFLQYPQPEGAQYFDLQATMAFSGKNMSVMEMTACTRWLRNDIRQRTGLTVIEMNMPTGFIVTNDVLRNYVKSHVVPTLARAEQYGQKIVFYLDYVEYTQKTCVEMTAYRWFPVANATIQHLFRVYDYYEPGMHNTTLVTTYGIHNQHICLVCGSFQCPYCPYYNAAASIHVNIIVIMVAISVLEILIRYITEERDVHVS